MNNALRFQFDDFVRREFHTLRAFAAAAGVSQETLFAWRRGGRVSPMILERIRRALGQNASRFGVAAAHGAEVHDPKDGDAAASSRARVRRSTRGIRSERSEGAAVEIR